jgi:hypothetical protein
VVDQILEKEEDLAAVVVEAETWHEAMQDLVLHTTNNTWSKKKKTTTSTTQQLTTTTTAGRRAAWTDLFATDRVVRDVLKVARRTDLERAAAFAFFRRFFVLFAQRRLLLCLRFGSFRVACRRYEPQIQQQQQLQ